MSYSEPTVECLSFDDFCCAESAWDEMVTASHSPVPFLCHAWLRQWWLHFGEGQEFVALVVRDGESFVAGAPLALRSAAPRITLAEIVGTGPVPTRGMGLADKADLVVRRSAPEAGRSLAAELAKLLDRVDVFDIKGFDEASPTAPALAQVAPRPASTRTVHRSVSPYLPLDGSWEAYLATRSGNFRKHLRKYWRNLERIGKVELLRLGPEDECRAWMKEVLAVNDDSWKAERGTNLFRHPSLRGFFLDLAPEMARKGWLDLHVIRIGGEATAYELCFDFGGRVFSYNGSYRRSFGKSSPGTALTAAVIEAACGRGRTEYDMLRGAEEYKTRWSDKLRSESRIILPASRRLARIYAYAGPYAKARLKQSPWLEQLGDRLAGLRSRLRYRS